MSALQCIIVHIMIRNPQGVQPYWSLSCFQLKYKIKITGKKSSTGAHKFSENLETWPYVSFS